MSTATATLRAHPTSPLRVVHRATPTPGVYRRRRVVAVLLLLALVFGTSAALSRWGAEAELADRVAGAETIAPGETLWDVAVATAPDGVDPRAQLAAIVALNGLSSSEVPAWTVVLIPAR